MNFISWIFFGLIAGYIAKAIHPGQDPGGWIITMIIGIAGGMLGGVLGMYLFHTHDVNGWNLHSFLLAVGGSVLILWLYGLIRRR